MIEAYHIVKESNIDDLIQSVLYEMGLDGNGRQFEPWGGLVVLPDGCFAQALVAYSENNVDSELLEEIDRLKAEKADMLAMLEELREGSVLSWWSGGGVPVGIVERLDETIRKARGEE